MSNSITGNKYSIGIIGFKYDKFKFIIGITFKTISSFTTITETVNKLKLLQQKKSNIYGVKICYPVLNNIKTALESFNDYVDYIKIVKPKFVKFEEHINLNKIKYLDIDTYKGNKLNMCLDSIEYINLHHCENIGDLDLSKYYMLKYFNMLYNTKLNTIIFPDSIEYVNFYNIKRIEYIKSSTVYGLPHIRYLCVDATHCKNYIDPNQNASINIPLKMPMLETCILSKIDNDISNNIYCLDINMYDKYNDNKKTIDLPEDMRRLQHLSLTGFYNVCLLPKAKLPINLEILKISHCRYIDPLFYQPEYKRLYKINTNVIFDIFKKLNTPNLGYVFYELRYIINGIKNNIIDILSLLLCSDKLMYLYINIYDDILLDKEFVVNLPKCVSLGLVFMTCINNNINLNIKDISNVQELSIPLHNNINCNDIKLYNGYIKYDWMLNMRLRRIYNDTNLDKISIPYKPIYDKYVEMKTKFKVYNINSYNKLNTYVQSLPAPSYCVED